MNVDIEDAMMAEKRVLLKKLNIYQDKFERGNFPEGRIQINKNGRGYKYYQVIQKDRKITRKYLKKDKIEIAKSLAIKNLLQKQISSTKMEIAAIDAYIKRHPRETPARAIKNQPAYRKLIDIPSYFGAECDDNWDKAEYEKSNKNPEKLKIATLKGDLVRSKAEAMIADALFRNGIQYRYECRLKVGNEYFYPDFIVKNKRTGKIYIWEHYGMMDDQKYISKYIYKSKAYVENGYVMSLNMLATFETEKIPLDSVGIDRVIENYLL